VLALVREALVVECLEDQVDLLLEQLAVGRLVLQWRPEGLDLAGVVAAPDPERYPPAGQDLGGGVVFGQPQRVPHRRDVKAAAELDPLGHRGEMHRRHQDVGDALHAFVLEMVFGHPERIVADPVHQLRHRLRLVEHARQVLVGVAAVVDRHAAIADILDIDVTGEQAVEFADGHRASSVGQAYRSLR
jgi:hypothetical protein